MSEPKRLSEKDVAEIRHGVENPPEQFNYASREEMLDDFSRKLLADRDAHLADLKEARELIQRLRHHHNAGLRCDDCKRADAFLERTK